MFKNFNEIVLKAMEKGAVTVAVAQAADIEVLKSICFARKKGLVKGVLIGKREKIFEILKELNEDPDNYTIINALDNIDCANKAVQSVKSGQSSIIMKGLLPTSTFLRPILNKENGLMIGKLISQISIFEWKDQDRLLLITDCAINVLPNLEHKKEILTNGLQLLKSLNINNPKVAVIAPVENVNPGMQETIDAAALSKMSERGDFEDCIVDGPLAFDVAISEEAVITKGIKSSVCGKADMLLMPCLNSANSVHKALVNISKLPAAGVVLGSKIPIISTSRSDNAETKFYSIAVASLLV